MKRIMIAGTHSGVGKTTLTAGLIYALRRRGQTVIPFKVGPDYIDAGFHAAAAGVPAGNLDSWMLPPDQVLEVMHRRVPPGAIAVIEGVMGLFDGRKGMGETGSSAHVAKITKTPVVLVANGAKMARSAAALVSGYLTFDSDVSFAGLVFNHLSGESHFEIIKNAVSECLQVPVFGYLPKNTEITVPERHLGLMPVAETAEMSKLLGELADFVETNLDVDAILAAAEAAEPLPEPGRTVFPDKPAPVTCRIAVAKDEAFHFYYPENLELLRACGAEIAPFSPLDDPQLPQGTDGIFLGGGFPEMFAERLASNETMRHSLQQACLGGMPMYAECGGYMYLSRELRDFSEESWPMAGVFTGRAVMRNRRRALGYVQVSGTKENYLLPESESCRGHEFHWSDMEETLDTVLYRMLPGGEPIGERRVNCLGSYIHLHFLSNPGVARRFVDACASYARSRGEKYASDKRKTDFNTGGSPQR